MNTRKDNICPYFLKGKCKFGNQCRSKHERPNTTDMIIENSTQPNPTPVPQNQPQPNIQQPNQNICRFYLQGNCKKGESCPYFHGFSSTLRNLVEEAYQQSELLAIEMLNNENFVTCNSTSFQIWTLNPSFKFINEVKVEGTISKLITFNGNVIVATKQEKMYVLNSQSFIKNLFDTHQYIFI